MSTRIPKLPGHAKKTNWLLGGCLGCVLLAAILIQQSIEKDSGYLTLMGVSLLAVGAGAGIVGSRVLDQSKCPACDAQMHQGGDRVATDGIFTCPDCGRKWSTTVVWGDD
jgi:hypothetical protein